MSQHRVGSNQYIKRPGFASLDAESNSPPLIQQASKAGSLMRPVTGPSSHLHPAMANQVLVRMDEQSGKEAVGSMLSILSKADQRLAAARALQYQEAQKKTNANDSFVAASEVVVQVMDDLDKAAPAGHWFGPSPTDLGGWGFWPDSAAPPSIWD